MKLLLITIKTGFASLLIATVPLHDAYAKHIYKYHDADGVLHFTDTPPDTDVEVETRRVKVEPQTAVRISTDKSGGRSRQIIQNRLYGPMEVQLRFVEADNVRAEPPLPDSFLLPRGFRGEKVVYKPINPRKGWRYKVNVRYVPGDPSARHDTSVLYIPPFPADKRFLVSQGFNGTSTHKDSIGSKYAVDLPMPIGTPIRAVRDGVVMEINEDFYGAGTDIGYDGPRANSIRILHGDGSMSLYAHLRLEGVFVQPGDVVLAGEVIGESGNTGFSTGPHLHFAIQVNRGMQLASVPFNFINRKGEAVRPDTGVRLRGVATP